MTTYLFVSESDNNHKAAQDACIWTCSSTTETDDQILVYVKATGIQYQWVALSDAKRAGYRTYECVVEYVRTFDPPISLSEICKQVTPQEWKAPHLNFRGYTSIQIPKKIAQRLITGRPSYQEVVIDPKSSKTYYNRGNAYADFGDYSKQLFTFNMHSITKLIRIGRGKLSNTLQNWVFSLPDANK